MYMVMIPVVQPKHLSPMGSTRSSAQTLKVLHKTTTNPKIMGWISWKQVHIILPLKMSNPLKCLHYDISYKTIKHISPKFTLL